MPSLTACIITLEEEVRLPACLAALEFCDEVIVVDSGSSDATVAIARAAGARVVQQPWLGYSAQRNAALNHATCDWILEVDADERVTPELRTEIVAFLDSVSPGVNIGALPLREYFLGYPLGPAAKYPKYRHRLFRRGTYRHDEERVVHERLIPEGPVQPFTGDLEHMLAARWGEALRDVWAYARLESAQMSAPRTLGGFIHGAFLRPTAKLAYRLLIDGGWRDGKIGLARIWLDCATDTLVWTRHVVGLRGSGAGTSGVSSSEHYGSWRVRRGSRRVVAVAYGHDALTAALLLENLAQGGDDVTLISDRCPEAGDIRVRRLDRVRPLALIRALEAEDQLRTIDAVHPVGQGARRMLRLVPRHLRGLESP